MRADHAIDVAPARYALIVDADDDTRQMYAEYLKLSAWEIDEASDGREALAKAISHPPDIVVTETHLPGISGYDLCSLLREDPVTAGILLVVVTADVRAVDRERAMDSGADLVLTKPCLPDYLVSEIGRLSERSSELRRRSATIRRQIGPQLSRAEDVLKRAEETLRRHGRKKSGRPRNAIIVPSPPLSLCCPTCQRQLSYQRSHVGGVGPRYPEQWDYYECGNGCGTFQYRIRTRKLRRVS